MIIFQKNFTDPGYFHWLKTAGQKKSGETSSSARSTATSSSEATQPRLNNYVEQAPQGDVLKTPWSGYAKPATPAKSQPSKEDYLQSALKKKKSISYYERNSLSPAEQQALDNHAKEIGNDFNSKALEEVKKDSVQTAPEVPTITEDVPVIDSTGVENEITPELNQFQADRKAEAAKLRAETGLIKGKAQEYLDKGREIGGKIKEGASNTWNKLSEGYGESTGRSLGTDAALAAGGLALAGGAYHLLKKRKAKKKAEKETLNQKIKK